jgi:ion channel-forming bestrophin family protein
LRAAHRGGSVTGPDRNSFWREAFALRGSVTPHVIGTVLWFGGFATGVCGLAWLSEWLFGFRLELETAMYEIAGAALGLVLILRTNAGYDRWWEARKLWGAIVNQSRNLAISALAYGPSDRLWRERFVHWAAVFPHIARCSLRRQLPSPEVVALVGDAAARDIADSPHMPSYVALQLADQLREACDRHDLDRFAFLQLDRERALLIDHIGGCERILKTPVPLVYSINIRRFIALFLLALPFALLHKMNNSWLIPLITMTVAYPLVAMDQMGIELQNPFLTTNLSHLPLGEISATIEANLSGLLEERLATEDAAALSALHPPALPDADQPPSPFGPTVKMS